MMRSLYSGVAGLKSHQTRMDVIGNNIANINTIGFKGSRTTFSDMLSQLNRNASRPTTNRGGVNPRQIGLGVNVESIDLIFTDSSPQQTGRNTDLALSGNGLFVLRGGEQEYYTRNGAFSFDEEGYYVMPGNGLRVQGWNAVDGFLETNSLPTDIQVPVGRFMDAVATTNIDYTGNLDKETLTIVDIQATPATSVDADINLVTTGKKDGFDSTYGSVNVDGTNCIAARLTLSDGSTVRVTSGYYEVGCSIPVTTLATVYDSLGGKHQVTILIDKDPSSATNPDAEAQATVTGITTKTTYTYKDKEGKEVTVPTTEYTGTVYSDGTNYYPDSQVTATAGTLKSDSNVKVTRQADGSYKVRASDNESYTLADINPTEYALTSSISAANPTVVTQSTNKILTYTDENGQTQYIAENADGVETTTTTTYDNRWRAYIAPGVGIKGPADEGFANTFTFTETDGSTVTGTMNPTYDDGDKVSYLYFDNIGHFVTEGRETGAAIRFDYANGNGAASNKPVTLDFTQMVQYASPTTSFPTSDGNAAGILQSIAVDGSGIISGTYTNGLVRAEAQIAVAQFTNASGLMKVGTTIYQESNNSGEANVRTVDTFGLTVTASALEMSNVDLASEFADMIITQRGFQANSKMTTVADEMLETVVNMKR